MATTAQELVYAGLRLAGVLRGPGRNGNSETLQDGLDALNTMIDGWNIDRLLLPGEVRKLYQLTAGVQSYRIGPGAPEFDDVRPSKIERASVIVPFSSERVEREVEVIDVAKWQSIYVKALLSDIPQMLYYDATGTWGVLNLYGVPTSSSLQLVTYVWQTLTSFASLATSVTLLPGYLRALEYNLALELASRWPEAEISPLVERIARQSKDALYSINAPSPRLRVDSGLPSRTRSFNWLINSSGGDGQLSGGGTVRFVQAAVSSGYATIDLSQGTDQEINLVLPTTAIQNPVGTNNTVEFTLYLKQDAVGGRAVTFGSSFLGLDPTSFDTTANTITVLTFAIASPTQIILKYPPHSFASGL